LTLNTTVWVDVQKQEGNVSSAEKFGNSRIALSLVAKNAKPNWQNKPLSKKPKLPMVTARTHQFGIYVTPQNAKKNRLKTKLGLPTGIG
jgi:hypothetical protein